jgi:hypothetical protein
MNSSATFRNECKFALLGLTNARADVPTTGVALPDGTEVLTQFPIELDSQWQSWLGIEASQVSNANLVLVRTVAAGFPPEALPISDDTSWALAKQVENVFSMLRLLGTIEYERAFLIMGYVQKGQAVCQHFSKFGRYEITRGCLPWMVREEHLVAAADLARAKSSLLAGFPDAQKVRLFRGWWALTTGLQQFYASDRLHCFVRALEALIYPQMAKTEKQFVHRCSLFAAPSTEKNTAREAIQDAFKMRCDVEHAHAWDRSLTKYAVADREDIAYWRTRQMESLACLAYAKILTNRTLQQHFYTDTALHKFWQMPEHEVRIAFGCVCDITKLKLVKNYDSLGRAQCSEWPRGWLETLERKHGGHASITFSALGFKT